VLKMLAKNPEDRYPDMASLTSALRIAAGPPFSVHRSSPELMNAPTHRAADVVVEPLPRAAKAAVTTFRTGTGERLADTKAPSSGSLGKIFGAGLALAALGGGAFILFGGSRSEPAPRVAAAPAAPKPAPPVAPAPVAGKPTPPSPAAKPRVTVRLASDPQGADVFDAQGGASLGTTPLTLTRSRGDVLKVRLEKEGYLSATRDVPLDEDQALEFALAHKPAAKPRPSHHVREEGPAKL
jgi:hypothetical protein